jgi:HrpA-like RNA helicase
MKAVSLEVVGNLVGVSDKENQQSPINYILAKIESIWNDSSRPNVLIVQAKTGSGKSVFMTKEIFRKFGVDVTVTQPTVINAMQIPQNIATLYKLKLGENLGYQTGAKSVIPRARPNLMFVT